MAATSKRVEAMFPFWSIAFRVSTRRAIAKENAYQPSVKCPSLIGIAIRNQFIDVLKSRFDRAGDLGILRAAIC